MKIKNISRSPVVIVFARKTESIIHPRAIHDSHSGKVSVKRQRMTIGTSLRLRVGETSETLPDHLQYDPQVVAAKDRGEIRIIEENN